MRCRCFDGLGKGHESVGLNGQTTVGVTLCGEGTKACKPPDNGRLLHGGPKSREH